MQPRRAVVGARPCDRFHFVRAPLATRMKTAALCVAAASTAGGFGGITSDFRRPAASRQLSHAQLVAGAAGAGQVHIALGGPGEMVVSFATADGETPSEVEFWAAGREASPAVAVGAATAYSQIMWVAHELTHPRIGGALKLDSIEPNGTQAWTLRRNATTPPQYPWVNGCRFLALNSLGLLDAPGEYYVARNGTLYFMPPGGGLTEDVLVSSMRSVVVAEGAHHTRWQNLTLEVSRSTVMLLSGDGLSVSGSTVRNGGGACVQLVGSNSSITGCVVYGCGRAGVYLQGGDRGTLTPSGNAVTGNTITNFSRTVRTYQPAVGWLGVGHAIAHNVIAHGPHTALNGGGNDVVVEHNRIDHVCFECTDTGAFYVGRSWTHRGNVLRHNNFTTIRATERLAQQHMSQIAIYLDDQMSGWDVYGNVVRNATQAVAIAGGRDNLVHENVFIDNDSDVEIDDRGLSWEPELCQRNSTSPLAFRIELEALRYTSPPYATHYPSLPFIYDAGSHPCYPAGNVVSDNTYCHRRSAGGGRFLSQNETWVRAHFSSVSNNVERCGA